MTGAALEAMPLGRAGLDVCRIVFGTDALGGHAWGAFDEKASMDAVALAAERGVNLFDTADCYGLGLSEIRLGKALADRPDARVASKFGVRQDAGGRTVYDNSSAWLDAALDASLTRLGRDHIDLYQVHYWDGARPLRDTFEQLEDKRREGKIGWYGVSNCTREMIGEGALPPGLVSCTFEASLVERKWEAEFDAFARADVAGLSWGSLGQGLLSGKYDRENRPAEGDRRNRSTYPKFHGAELERNLRIVDALREMAPRYPGRTTAQLAIRWLLDHRATTAAIVGMKTMAQVDDVLGALGWNLNDVDQRALGFMSSTPAQ